MDERVIQLRVGIVVLATAFITVILIMWFGELPGFVRGEYSLHIHFESAPGVNVNTPVRKSGILIGRVSEIELREDGVLITASMHAKENERVYHNEVCRIATESLLGDSVLEFVASSDPAAPHDLIKDGEYITGQVSTDPLRMLANMEDDMVATLASVRGAGEQVGNLAETISGMVDGNEDQFDRLLEKTEIALDQFAHAMESLDGLVGDEEFQQRLRDSLENVPTLLAESRETLDGIRRMTDLAEENLNNISAFTKPLGERGEDLVIELESTIHHLDEFFIELRDFSSSLNSEEGTIGQLIHNPDLYQRLNRAAENVEFATRQLEPLVADARIFMDKIARNPRQLGVQGALDRERSGTKYLLPFETEEARQSLFRWPY